ncbi:MAG TPA: hypothetical protein VMU36_02425 [Spirochaetia bacterium]|nr:hypothetical protein [Spirochaetia bacterium]
MKNCRNVCLFAIVVLCGMPLSAAPAIYRSNDFGMRLEPLPPWRRFETTWVLEVTAKANGEVRRLLQDGKEVRRWEISRAADSRREERELASGVLAARRIYSPAGALLEEDQYSKGSLAQKSLYTYASSRVVRVRVLAADGAVVSTDEYFYSPRGSLREVRRTSGKEGTHVSWFVEGSSGLSEERETSRDTVFIARYDTHGRIVEKESRTGKETVSLEDFVYRADAGHSGGRDLLLSSVEKHPGEGRVVSREYDTDGKLQRETISTGGKVVEEIQYVRDEKGRVIRKLRRGPAGLEEWRYVLDDNGKATREDFFSRGSLQKVTMYGANDTRTEELYQDGALFLKVYFEGDRRAREEVYVDGNLIRQRTFD